MGRTKLRKAMKYFCRIVSTTEKQTHSILANYYSSMTILPILMQWVVAVATELYSNTCSEQL